MTTAPIRETTPKRPTAPKHRATAATPFTLGFTNPLGSNDQLAVLQSAIEARAECLGGDVISVDSNLDVDKQISDIDQLISQDVDGIIVFPLDAEAVHPRRATGRRRRDQDRRRQRHTRGSRSRRHRAVRRLREPGHRADGDRDRGVRRSTNSGGTGNVLGVGIGFPVPVIDYQMAVMEETVDGRTA